MPEESESDYANIRQIIGKFIGKRIVDISQHDQSDWEENEQAFVTLMFEDGSYLKLFLSADGVEFFEAVTGEHAQSSVG